MSTIRKIPFIEKTLGAMTTSLLKDLKSVINGNQDSIAASFANMPSKNTVKPVYFTFEDGKIRTGILIYTDDLCVLIAYHKFQDLQLFSLNPTKHTYDRINEYCDIDELRRVLDDTVEATGAIDSGDAEKGQVPVADGDGGVEWKDIPETLILTGESGTLTDDELALAKQSDVRLQLGDNGQFYYKNSQNNYYIIFKATARVAGDDTIVEKVTIDLSDNTYAYSYDVVAAGESFTPTYDDELSDASTNAVQNKVVTEALDKKADIVDLENGQIEPARAKVAKALEPSSQDIGSTQETPFIYQAAGTENNTTETPVSPTARQLEKQGNTVVVNQLCPLKTILSDLNGITITANNSYEYTIVVNNPTGYNQIGVNLIDIIVGHKYLLFGGTNRETADIEFYIEGQSGGGLNNYEVIDGTVSGQNSLYLYVGQSTPNGTYKVVPKCIDLTQWFGSNDNIPAYLLSHPETFGNYYQGSLAYNTGTLTNSNGRYLVCGQSRNLWDEESQVGAYTSNGSRDTTANTICSKNKIRVIPNAQYYFFVGSGSNSYCRFVWYDKDENLIDTEVVYSNGTFTVPANAIYMNFTAVSNYGTTYNHDITISEYFTTGTDYNQYYPYVAPKTYDTGSEVLLAFDKKTPNGTIYRNTGLVDLGSLNWGLVAGSVFTVSFPDAKAAVYNLIAENGYQPVIYYATLTGTDKSIYMSGNGQLYVNDSSYTDAATFKTAMSGVYLEYELATPTTESGTPFTDVIEVNDYGFMAWLDTSENYVITPQGCKIFYPADLVSWTEDAFTRTNGDTNDLVVQSELNAVDNKIGAKLPACPTDTDGTYILKATVSSGAVTYEWVLEQ